MNSIIDKLNNKVLVAIIVAIVLYGLLRRFL